MHLFIVRWKINFRFIFSCKSALLYSMKIFVVLVFFIPSLAFGQIRFKGVFCPPTELTERLQDEKDHQIVNVFWFQDNGEAKHYFILKVDQKIYENREGQPFSYTANPMFLYWGNGNKLNRKSLEYSYIGVDGVNYTYKCILINDWKQIDMTLDFYSSFSRSFLSTISKNKRNKI